MTEAQICAAYAKWLPESLREQAKELFPSEDLLTVNFDLFEDEKSLKNRVYTIVPHLIDNNFACFVFYRDNTFKKDKNGDLVLTHWEYGVGEPLLYGGGLSL